MASVCVDRLAHGPAVLDGPMGWCLTEMICEHLQQRDCSRHKSVNGASIKGIRVGASSKTEIVILGGEHAREWIGPAVLMHVVENVLQAAELRERDTVSIHVSILDNFQVTILR